MGSVRVTAPEGSEIRIDGQLAAGVRIVIKAGGGAAKLRAACLQTGRLAVDMA
jgi:hypothetical protein